MDEKTPDQPAIVDAAPAAHAPAAAPPPEPQRTGPTLLERLPVYLVPLILIGVPALFYIAAQLAPVEVGDKIVWQYYWGPIKADADNVEVLVQNGVEAHTGYNLVNTFSWAVLLGVCILGTAQLLARKKAVMDSTLIVGAVGWVVAGSVFHVLEDVSLFGAPLQYFFITPPIYLLFAAMGVASFVVGHYLKGVAEKAGLERALQKMWFVVVLPIVCYLMLYLPPQWNQVHAYVNPVIVALLGLVAYLLAAWRFRRIGRIEPSEFVGFMSIGWILLSLAYVWTYIYDPWPGVAGKANVVALWAPVLAAAVVMVLRWAPKRWVAWLAIVLGGAMAPVILLHGMAFLLSKFGIAWQVSSIPPVTLIIAWVITGLLIVAWMGSRFEKRRVTLEPRMAMAGLLWINALLVFAQLLDGFATSIGIDGLAYKEKHVLSAWIIDSMCESFGGQVIDSRCVEAGAWWVFGAQNPSFLGFLPVKLLVSLLVIYAIDVANPEDAQRHPTMIGLVKFAIIMVGLGPGIRDFVRMALGV